MKQAINITKGSGTKPYQMTYKKGTKKTVINFTYDAANTITHIDTSGDLLDLDEISALIPNFVPEVTVLKEQPMFQELTRQNWLHDGSYTERWEQGFNKFLYHGRTGSYWQSESISKAEFADWTTPRLAYAVNGLQPAPWNNALRMRNSIDDIAINQVYVGFPRALHRGALLFDANLTNPAGGLPDEHYIGFEVNSGGGYGFLACLSCQAGQWYLWNTAYNKVGGGDSTAVTLNNPGVFARYGVIYDPPYLELWEAPAANPGGALTRTVQHDLTFSQGKGIPFFANEDTAISEFQIGNVWIYEILPRPIYRTTTQTNAAANLTLTLNSAAREHVAVYAESNQAVTVLVQVSLDGATWQDVEELTTAILNGVVKIYKVYENAYRYWKVTVEEFGAGKTELIEITTSAN